MSWRILHVDDEPDIREIVVMALELDPAFEPVSFGSGREAVEWLAGGSADLVLLDYMMPQMDGPATMEAIRAAGHADIPIVFMTARAGSEASGSLIPASAAGVIVKPFDPFALADKLREFLQ